MPIPLLGPADAGRVGAAAWRTGLLRLYRPSQVALLLSGLRRYGFSPAAGPYVGRVLHPGETALVDDDGRLTFSELDAACDRSGLRLAAAGLAPGDAIGLLARSSRGFYAAFVGAARAGVDVGYLNPGATRDQVAATVREHGLDLLVHDGELADLVPAGVRALSVEDLCAPGPDGRPSRGGRTARHVVLTSGTTGTPRGVARTTTGIDAAAAVLSGLPYRERGTHLVAAPAFHAWGWMNVLVSMLLSSTLVLTRRFDPERVLALVEREQVDVLVAVPVMLSRLLALPEEVRGRYDTSSLEAVAVSGSALTAELGMRFMDAYGDLLYNLYGSTEASFATVASPPDLRAAPGCAGRPLAGVKVEVLDPSGRRVTPGEVGEVVVRSGTTFSGYTSGDDKQRTRGGVHVGDLGCFDEAGRLFVVGRADDMVVTGGENVYPVPVEQALERHPDVAEVAVVGEPDHDLGQALVAHVVLRPGSATTGDALRAWAKQHLARHEVPRRVVLHADPLPRTTSGKVLKRDLTGGGSA